MAARVGALLPIVEKYFFFVKQSIFAYLRSSFLGILWTLLLPMVNGFILIAIYTSIFHFPLVEALFYIWPGFFIWNYFVSTTSTVCTSINAGKVKVSANPNILFPLSQVFNFFPPFIVSYIIIIIAKIVFHQEIPFVFILNLIPSFAAFLLFTVGNGLVLSVLYVFFRDINHIWGLICQIGFFLCPILLPESFLTNSRYWILLKWNPMFYLIKFIRDPILTGELPALNLWIICWLLALFFAASGVFIFQKMNKKFIHFL